ncbi:MAG TPA: AAA family ATPase, partial [Propionibacteriaceae bacterium]
MTSRPPVESTRLAATLVGRTHELRAITGLVQALPSTGCRFLLVGGDAGLGKTTLVDAAVARLDTSVVVVRGQCVPLGGEGLPYAPVHGLLHDLNAVVGTEQLLEWAGGGRRALAAVVPDLVQPDEGGANQLQLFEAIARLLGQVAQTQPLLIVVEDLHWADESTRQLLLFLPGALRRERVALIGTYRPDEIGRRHPMRGFLGEAGRMPLVSRLDLGPLGRDSTAQLVEAVLGRPANSQTVTDIQLRSGGVPFYVKELASWTDSRAMPTSVRDAVHGRLDRLSDGALAMIRIAAVLGDRVPHEALVAMMDEPEERLEPHLREAVDTGVFTVDHEAYVFRHALLREAVEDDLLPGERARLHRHAAATLEQQPQLLGESVPHAIALHWAAGRDHDKAFAWSLRAARSGTAAHSEALRMYERVLELWDLVPDPASTAGSYAGLLEAAARTAKDAGEYERALQLATQALGATADDDHQGRFSRLMLHLHLLIDLIRPGAEADVAEAQSLLGRLSDARFRAHALEQLAAYHLNTGGSGGSGEELAREAVAAAVAVGDPLLVATAHNTLGSILIAAGADDEGLDELSRAGDLLGAGLDGIVDTSASEERRAVVRFHLNYSDALHSTGQYAAALEQAMAGVRAARAYGIERDFGSFVAGNAAESLIAVGRLSEASDLIEEALRLDPPTMSATHLRLMTAWTALWRGELKTAESVIAPLRSLIADPQPMPQTTAEAIRIDAELATFTGRPERAWSHFLFFSDHRRLYDPARSLAILAAAAAAATRLDRREPDQRQDRVRVVA